MQDQRQIPRWQVNQRARFNLSQSMDWCDCQLDDISLKGLRITLPQSFNLREPIGMSLLLEDGFALRVEGIPCWSKPSDGQNSYGISFTRIFDEDKERIFQFIQKHCADQFKQHWWGG